ncbi:MAG: tRNA (N6-isopentenyl adenosine(37)-C2)-methylthiotransferase MiaB [Desulfuromonadales bacterium]|nr:tRNA (N6-isopentenyl adenosine(37)-C2)-methylthiotransferase MiaB [Desulfuromonadales bacterium]
MTKLFFMETFGCQMNVVDSERIADMLTQIGYLPTADAEQADLVLLNTCSIRDKAERKVYGHLGSFKPLKEKKRDLIVCVGGCVAQQEGERLLEKVPHLDIVFGTHNLHKLPEMVRLVEQKKGRFQETQFLDQETRLQLFPQRRDSDAITRFVTIMQGCDNFCSYCIVPHVRGREISRPSREIVQEVIELAAEGVREITLIGQNVNSYGNRVEGEISFAQLLELVADIDGIERIRFTTSHPKDISDELIACFGRIEKICHHIHLPVQSGSDRILQQMNRGYTRPLYLDRVAKLRAVCPDIRITTDIIVGFPGETEDDFIETLSLVEAVGYADAFTFLYSARPGTSAADLKDDFSADVKQRRFDRLLALQQENSRQIWAQDVGSVLSVLVEGESRQGSGQLYGRTTWNRVVNFTGSDNLIGETVSVKIIKNNRNTQLGERVSKNN